MHKNLSLLPLVGSPHTIAMKPRLLPALLSLLTSCLSAEQIVFSEIMYHPPAGGHEFVEIQNLTATPFDIAEWELSNGVDFTFPAFSDGAPLESFLKAFERIVICNTDPATFRATYGVPTSLRVFGPWTGQLSNSGERITLDDKNGVGICTVSYEDRHPWPLAADGAGHSLILTDTSFAIDDYRVWSSAPPTPGFSLILNAEESFPNPEVNLSSGIPFVNYADEWAFNDQNLNLGTTWKETNYAFTHAGWTLVGAAGNNGGLYGFETSAVPAPGMQTALLNSDNAANHITYYFRKEFTYNGPTTGANVTIDMINDDSAYFYLNGVPIGGLGIGPNPDWKDRSSRTVNNATEELAIATNNGSDLVAGTNVICAEVHQVNDGSSDVVFGARLSIAAPSNPSVLINEVLPSSSGFIELFNPGATTIDLAGWYLSDTPGNLTKYQIPAGLTIPSSGLASIDYSATGFTVTGNTVLYLTETDGSTITNAIDATVPLDGRSLGRKGDGSSSWFLFSESSKNAPNASSSGELGLKINEAAFNQDGETTWVELFNSSGISLDTTGLFLASQPDFSDKIALTGNVPASGFLTIAETFPTNGGELTLFLISGSDTLIDAASLTHRSPRNFSAAFPDGSSTFYASGSGSPGTTNNPNRETGIVFSELMVDPPTDHRDGEFIELHNRTATAIDLSGWEFTDGVNFSFPSGTTLSPGQYLVIAANQNFFNYPNLVGQYEGGLANGGELLRLVDSWGNLADEVHYHTGGNWPTLAGGQGSSLELKHPDMDNSKASAWADSDESNKTSFETYTLTEQFQNITTRGGVTDYEELHLQAVGDAHLAFQNLSLTRNGGSSNILPGGGNSVVTNGSGANGWLCQGTHHLSFASGSEFHLVSNGHGDVKANRCEIDVTQIADNDTLTFTFDARWVSGKPTFVVETWDRSFGGIFHLPVPRNLGSPGTANPGTLSSPSPTVSGLIHSPPVPSTSDPVRVTAHVSGATSVNLRHRLDTSAGNGNWNSTTMFDDGTSGGDEIANDDIFSATLTNYQNDNAIVQFYVEANSPGGTTTQPRLAPERPAMWVVDNTTHPTDLRLQRFIISARDQSASGNSGDSATFNFSFPRLSNNYFNSTFISDDRDIIYNCEMRKSGSPWTRSSGSDFSRMKWKPPGDRKFRGYAKRAIDNDAGGSRAYHNRIIRYWLYLFGHAANENEFVRVVVNGGNASLREDVEPNSTDFLKRNWEDGQKGELYRIDDQWWFDDNWGRQNQNATWAYKNTTEPERYSSEWIKRSRESEYDYSSFISWTDMVDNDTFTREEMERTADIDMMAANAVVRGWCDDWDTLTRNRGKNGYFLRRATDGKWMLIQWDSDNTFRTSTAAFLGNLTGVRNFYDKPYVRQRFNHYLNEMVTKYTANSSRLNAWFQCEEDASNSYPSNQNTYTTWNNARLATANSTIGTSALNTPFNVTSGNGSSLTTSADTVTLQGTSGADAFEIRAVGHPDAIYEFNSTTGWTLSGIQLQQGSNSIQVQALDQTGAVMGTETFIVSKTGNALPVVVLDADPNSYRIPVGSIFAIDASESYDPEGTALTYDWQISAASFTNPTPASSEMTFTTPGHYNLVITVRDTDGNDTVINREIVAYANSGWDPFNQEVLASAWTPENLSVRDGSTPPSSYTLDDNPSNLTLKVEEDFPKPLTLNSPVHPTLWRDTPSGNWSFTTDLVLASVQQGDFYTGLILDGAEGATPTRYTIGMEDGDFLRVKRITSGSVTTLATLSWSDTEAVIRVLKNDTSLTFQYREEPGLWTDLHTRTFTSGSTTIAQAGLFAATDIQQALRVEFDFALLVDPNVNSATLDHLRITEIMYHPIAGGSAEFIEVLNTGTTPLILDGAGLEDARPFNAFTFAALTLAPGQYAVLVSDETTFRQQYGPTPVIIGEWSGGNLSNGGETIELRDPFANVIHDFSYDDAAPWPTTPDGSGPSLEVIDPEGDYNDPLNWRASAFTGGSPGLAFATDLDGDGLSNIQESALGTDPNLADTDRDELSDSAELITGTDPLDPSSTFKILSSGPTANPDEIRITWSSIAGKTYIVESSHSLTSSWDLHDSILATGPVSATTDDTHDDDKFYRIRVTGP